MRYIVGVGSNKGDRWSYIHRAKSCLNEMHDMQVLKEASAFENPAQGGPAGQQDFINTAWLVESAFGPHQVLHCLQAIERRLGRTRTVVHGSRSIDLDLLVCDAFSIIDNVVLVLPHPRMHQRDFVLVPINEIAPDWIHPIIEQPMHVLLNNLHRDPNA